MDVTADVNFAMCRKAAEKAGNIHVLPLVTQSTFLINMGIFDRTERLINDDSISEEEASYVLETMKKLVDPAEMGERFKVMSIIHPSLMGKVFGFDPVHQQYNPVEDDDEDKDEEEESDVEEQTGKK